MKTFTFFTILPMGSCDCGHEGVCTGPSQGQQLFLVKLSSDILRNVLQAQLVLQHKTNE